MKRLLPLLVCLALLPDLLSAQNPAAIDTVLTMSDGVRIEALYVLPLTAPPASGYPAILSIHGFGGNKDQLRNDAIAFAKLGYAAAAYSVRGQGGSGGVFDFFNSVRILGDLRELIAFTKSLPDVNPERVGVTGGSQGGLHAWAASAYNMDVRAAVSMIANGRFLEDWTENHAMNYIFAATMTGTTVNLAPEIRSTVQTAVQTNNILPVQGMLDTFQTAGMERSASVPVLMMFSYYDQFFNPTAGLRQFQKIGAPKRAFTYPGRHGASSIAVVNSALVLARGAWFEYWLKDNPAAAGVVSRDSALVMFDGATGTPHYFAAADSAVYLDTQPGAPGIVPFKLHIADGALAAAPSATEASWNFNYLGGVGGPAAVFRSEPLPEDVTLAGSAAYAQIMSTGTAARYQVNVDLNDYDPATQTAIPISRGHFQENENTPGTRNLWRFYLNAMMHTVKAGHQVEAHIIGGEPAILAPVNNEVLGTGVTSINTLYSGGAASSYIQLYAYDPGTTSTGVLPAPAAPMLSQNYPNPFGSGAASGMETTYIPYTTSSFSASLEVYNSMGRLVAALHTPGRAPGTYTAQFNAAGLPAGAYFAVLRDGNTRAVRAMAVVR